jgi:predicted TPR repeat methyltransferase
VSDPSIEKAILLADRAQRGGLLAEAEAVCREILVKEPGNAGALRILGVVCRKSGRALEALEHLKASVAGDERDAATHRDLGDALRAAGKFEEAAAEYARAIELQPDWPEAYGAMGNALRDAGKLPEAIEAYTKATRLRPNLAMAHLRLGEALHEAGRREAALGAIGRAIELKPDWAEACNSLGNVLWDQQKIDEAMGAYEKARALEPGYPPANWSLGKLLAKRGDAEGAIQSFKRVVDFHPSDAMAHLNLARMLRLARRIEEACAEYREAIRLAPGREDFRFELAACSGDGSARGVPDQYIRDLFDEYSSSYDRHVVGELEYRVPGLLLEAARGRQFESALDLGCGTGLCGEAFRSIVGRLSGVDLSEKMIEGARARGIYDELLQGDLLAALWPKAGAFDLIVAGDVLGYVGDLSRLFPAVGAGLKSGGIFVFSIEHFDGPGFFLHGRERFGHSMQYVREMAAAAGLREISATQVLLRRQGDARTPGWIVVLGK